MEQEPSITLHTEDLFSKFGFNDGDDPEAWLDYCDAHGIDYNAIEYPLVRLVRAYLLPALNKDVIVVEIETIHNPIRAIAVNGIEGLDDIEADLTPESVTVPMSAVLQLAEAPAPPAAHDTRPQTSRRW